MIRKIGKKDREDFIRLSEMFYKSEAVLHDIPTENHDRLFRELMASDEYAEGYIFEEAGKAVGYGLLAKTYSRESGGKVIWIEEVFVLPEYRSRGFGREFFAKTEDHARACGCVRIRLELEPCNERARSLYARMGYRPLDYSQMYKEI